MVPARIYCVLGPLTKRTQIGKWPKNAIKVFQRGGKASWDAIGPADRDVGVRARFYCVLGPLTKMTPIGKWPKNATNVFQRGVKPLEMQLVRPVGM